MIACAAQLMSFPPVASAHDGHVHETPADGFSAAEVDTIRGWFDTSPDAGLDGAHGVPQAILDRLVPGEKLLQGMPRRRLPEALLKILPTAHPGYERMLIGDRVLLLDLASGLIVDVIERPDRGGIDETGTRGEDSEDQRPAGE